jgi:hypothetical protein
VGQTLINRNIVLVLLLGGQNIAQARAFDRRITTRGGNRRSQDRRRSGRRSCCAPWRWRLFGRLVFLIFGFVPYRRRRNDRRRRSGNTGWDRCWRRRLLLWRFHRCCGFRLRWKRYGNLLPMTRRCRERQYNQKYYRRAITKCSLLKCAPHRGSRPFPENAAGKLCLSRAR